MCFAIPGKVVEIEGDKVIVDYEIEKREVTDILGVSVGDYVIVSNKIIIKIVPREEALEAIGMVKDLVSDDVEESVEWYFFKYAFPCSQTLMQLGRISSEEYSGLKEGFEGREAPSQEILERVFSVAFERIDRLAVRMGLERWNFDVVKGYWGGEHNEVIARGEGMYGSAPESFKDLCRINIGEVVEVREGLLIVGYLNEGREETRVVDGSLVNGVKVGDKIKIHYGYGVEKVE